MLQQLVKAYDALPAERRLPVERARAEFEIVSAAATIETTLVRWHSAIDFYCKRAGFDKGSAKMRIVGTCDALGVRLDDVVGADALRQPERGRFSFTDLRNQFVHDGFDVFDGRHEALFEAARVPRALAERMLLASLGLKEPVGHLGTHEPTYGLI